MRLFYFLSTFLLPSVSHAHVKWFSNYNFQEIPLKLNELFTGTFWFLFILSLVSLPLIVYLDKYLENSLAYIKINSFLDRYENDAQLIMRMIVAAVLLMSWQGDSMVAPEIPIPGNIWGWAQFVLVFLLLFRETTWLTGLGMIFFYFVAASQHGVFHMLDYIVYPAVGLYFILSSLKNDRLRNLDLPVLYSGLGFSLCWVAFEKLIYPFWGLSVLAKAPELSMGLDHQFFLTSTAFVEFTLGYLLIIALLQRPLAIVITLVFFTTTAFFGKTEVIGHTILHGALLVFIVKGPGHYYQAPIRFHKAPWMRSIFAIINFTILFALMAFTYDKLAHKTYVQLTEAKLKEEHPHYEHPVNLPIPSVAIAQTMDLMGGWNLQFTVKNFIFTPERTGTEDIDNTGHAHLYLDGRKIARIYGPWFHLTLPKGHHKVKIGLTTNSHKDYYVGGKEISATIEIDEQRGTAQQHQH